MPQPKEKEFLVRPFGELIRPLRENKLAPTSRICIFFPHCERRECSAPHQLFFRSIDFLCRGLLLKGEKAPILEASSHQSRLNLPILSTCSRFQCRLSCNDLVPAGKPVLEVGRFVSLRKHFQIVTTPTSADHCFLPDFKCIALCCHISLLIVARSENC